MSNQASPRPVATMFGLGMELAVGRLPVLPVRIEACNCGIMHLLLSWQVHCLDHEPEVLRNKEETSH